MTRGSFTRGPCFQSRIVVFCFISFADFWSFTGREKDRQKDRHEKTDRHGCTDTWTHEQTDKQIQRKDILSKINNLPIFFYLLSSKLCRSWTETDRDVLISPSFCIFDVDIDWSKKFWNRLRKRREMTRNVDQLQTFLNTFTITAADLCPIFAGVKSSALSAFCLFPDTFL